MPGNRDSSSELVSRAIARLRDVLTLPFSFVGRRRIFTSGRYRFGSITCPLASVYRRFIVRRTRVVTVIGSLGKTTTARTVSVALGLPLERIVGWNAGGFLAEAVYRIRRSDRHAVLEVGAKIIGRMKKNGRLLRPEIAIVTSISSEHHRTLGPLESIRNEKADMLRALPRSGIAILNGDDENVRWMGQQTKANILTFGFDPANDIWASGYRSFGIHGGRIEVHAEGEVRQVRTRLIGRHMVYPVLAALTVARAEGISWAQAVQAVENLPPTPHRLQPRVLREGTVLMMDDYKATFETIEPALIALSKLPVKRRLVVLGETYDAPGDEAKAYWQEGKMVAQACDRVIFVGSEQRYQSLKEGATAHGMNRDNVVTTGVDVLGVADLLFPELCPEVAILFKASDIQRFERLALLLEGHRVTCARSQCLAPLSLECESCKELLRLQR